jgi:hypothetical protein
LPQVDGSGAAAVTSTVPSFAELANSKPSGLLMPKNKKSGPGSVVKMPPPQNGVEMPVISPSASVIPPKENVAS